MSRYSLGMRIENTILEIIELGYLAQAKRDTSRLLILGKMDVKLRVFFVHLRLAYQTKCLNDSGYAELSGKAVEIGKMIGGWIKQTKTAPESTARFH
ncbi:MAG: four helix bundle protein [Candidatus Moraniibacteriota bacterium]